MNLFQVPKSGNTVVTKNLALERLAWIQFFNWTPNLFFKQVQLWNLNVLLVIGNLWKLENQEFPTKMIGSLVKTEQLYKKVRVTYFSYQFIFNFNFGILYSPPKINKSSMMLEDDCLVDPVTVVRGWGRNVRKGSSSFLQSLQFAP